MNDELKRASFQFIVQRGRRPRRRPPSPRAQWAKVIDQTRCIGCHACTTACKSENLVPSRRHAHLRQARGRRQLAQARRAHQVTRCNQCAHAPCVTACPTSAMFKRPDGIVDFDKRICIGCKACMAACPYDAIFINPEDHSAEKCNFCAHRIDSGLEPACVVVCPTEAILVGDMNDPTRASRRYVNREPVSGAPPREGDAPQALLQGRAPGDARPARRAPPRRRPLHVERAEG
jgi:Fe-S-cluster-containing dehydrogenase component